MFRVGGVPEESLHRLKLGSGKLDGYTMALLEPTANTIFQISEPSASARREIA